MSTAVNGNVREKEAGEGCRAIRIFHILARRSGTAALLLDIQLQNIRQLQVFLTRVNFVWMEQWLRIQNNGRQFR